MFKSSIKPEDVFTPRADKVQGEMYVSRPYLETALKSALRMPKHIVVHGESGSGKSWLYKKVFQEEDVCYEVINLGRAVAVGSIANVIEQALARHNEAVKSGFSESKEAEVGLAVAKGKLEHSSDYVISQKDIFERCLAVVRKKAGQRTACLVFDNLEHILHRADLVAELAGLLLLVDDSNYAKYGVRILLVGTPNDMRSYIAQASSSNTITNRLTEIDEVARLSEHQANGLIQKGLFDLLAYEVAESADLTTKSLIANLSFYADRIPQYLQEICLHIAFCAERNDGVIDFRVFDRGRHDFVKSSLIGELALLESNMNSRATKIGRKNQVIYAMAYCKKYDFTSSDVESYIRKSFPSSSDGVVLNVPQILSELSSAAKPMIRRSPSGNAYRFVDPKLRIITRLKMHLQPDESLFLRTFDDSVAMLNGI